MKINKEDFETLQKIKGLTSVGKGEIHMMQSFINKYIDKHCKICPHCPGQIRFAHKRILKWLDYNQVQLQDDGCIVCGDEITDKRRKDYCSDDCKNKQVI